MQKKAPLIHQFLDFRIYLKEVCDFHLFKTGKSLRALSRDLGFKSHASLKLIFDGKRNLSDKSLKKFIDFFELNKTEAEVLRTLIALEHSKSPDEQEKYISRIKQLSKKGSELEDELSYFEFFAKWYYVAIYEYLPLEWREIKVSELSKHIGISSSECQKALKLLEKISLIKRDGDFLKKREEVIRTPEFVENLVINRYHRQMASKALDHIETFGNQHCNLGALTIDLSEESFKEFADDLASFRRRMNSKYSGRRKTGKVFQANLHLFPLFKPQA